QLSSSSSSSSVSSQSLPGSSAASEFSSISSQQTASSTASVAPVLQAIISAPASAIEGGTVLLSATESTGDIDLYLWQQTAGVALDLIDTNTITAAFVVPALLVNESVTIQLTVTDSNGASHSASIHIQLEAAEAALQPPTADAGSDNSVSQGANVILDGRDSHDIDGDIVSFTWEQTAGPDVVLDDADLPLATFTAPSVDSITQLVFSLTVIDDDGLSH